jgi:hypothetical protein
MMLMLLMQLRLQPVAWEGLGVVEPPAVLLSMPCPAVVGILALVALLTAAVMLRQEVVQPLHVQLPQLLLLLVLGL